MILNGFAIFFAASELLKQLLLTLSEGRYIWWYFPFQLCSMPIYLLPAYLLTRKDEIRDFLIDYSLLGGVCAFLDQSGMQYRLPVLTLHSYLWHILMIALAVYLIREKALNFKARSKRNTLLKEVILLWELMGIAECINAAFHSLGEINMFYISPFEPMRQIVFADMVPVLGQGGTILFYMIMLTFGGLCVHFLVEILCARLRRTMQI